MLAPFHMDPNDGAVSQWAYEHRQPAGTGTDNLPGAQMLFVPLVASRGIVGVLVGIIATAIYAGTKHWVIVIPVEAWSGGIASAIVIGAFAGLMPAIRASRLPPTVALRTV